MSDAPMTLKEAAAYGHVTHQAVRVAIKRGLIKYHRNGRRIMITRADYDEYRLNRFNRLQRQYCNGEKVFDIDAGLYNVQLTAKILGEALDKSVTTQRVYYLLRMGQLKAHRKGTAWVVKKDDIIQYVQNQTERALLEYRVRG